MTVFTLFKVHSKSLIALLLFLVAGRIAAATIAIPYSTNFGQGGEFEPGPFNEQNGWTVVSGEVAVVHGAHGSSFLRLEPANQSNPAEVLVNFSYFPTEVAYVRLNIRPVADPDLFASTFVDLERLGIRFKRFGEIGRVYVTHGDGVGGVMWHPADASFPVMRSGLAEEPIDLTLRVDFGNGVGDLWVGEELITFEIGLDVLPPAYLAKISIRGHSTESSSVHSLVVNSAPPEFLLLEEAEIDERDQSRALASEKGSERFVALSARGESDEALGRKEIRDVVSPEANRLEIHVDSAIGSDLNDGRSRGYEGASGPKATIEAASNVNDGSKRIIVYGGGPAYKANKIPEGTILKPGVRVVP